jgi:hypothetical protein
VARLTALYEVAELDAMTPRAKKNSNGLNSGAKQNLERTSGTKVKYLAFGSCRVRGELSGLR